jgi:hypothetical protein
MNNIKNILLVAIIAATLVLGTSVIPMQSYADRDNDDDHHKKGKDFSKIIANSESDKKSSNQHQDQENICYRGDDDCQQANQGQEIVGKDNEAKGFNDQSDNNLDLSAIDIGTGAGNGNGNGNGTGNGNGNGNGNGTGNGGGDGTDTCSGLDVSVVNGTITTILCLTTAQVGLLDTLPVPNPANGKCTGQDDLVTITAGTKVVRACISSLEEILALGQ